MPILRFGHFGLIVDIMNSSRILLYDGLLVCDYVISEYEKVCRWGANLICEEDAHKSIPVKSSRTNDKSICKQEEDSNCCGIWSRINVIRVLQKVSKLYSLHEDSYILHVRGDMNAS